MTEKKRWPMAMACAIAERIRDDLAPFCTYIEIAGSIRREKPEVGDAEILFVPRFETRPDGLFDKKLVDIADEALNRWLDKGRFAKRLSVIGVAAWGIKNKLALDVASGLPVDFFSTTEENRHVALVIRTGPKESNLRLTMGAQARGGSLEAYGAGVRHSDGTLTAATSEPMVFELCGVPYADPSRR